MKNYGFVRCAIATFDGSLCNPQFNATKIKKFIDEAIDEDVHVLVLPELCLTGYTCQDLFTTTDLLEVSINMLSDICDYTLIDRKSVV